jgi:hypothetical protein
MSQKFDILTKEEVQYLCGLIRKVVTVSEAIDDINLRSDGTFSSVKIDNLIKLAKQECNEYSDQVCSALIKLTCKKTTVQPTLDNSETNVIYLYSADGNAPFEQWLKLSDTELVDMGSTTITLDGYYTIDQCDGKFALKTDLADVVTAVNEIKNTIGTDTLNTTDKTLIGGINEVKDSIDTKIDKSKIITTIDSSSTDEQVPSAKVTYDEINCGKEINDDIISKYGTEIYKYPIGRWYIPTVEIYMKMTDLPSNSKTACTIDISSITPHRNITSPWCYRNIVLRYICTNSGYMYIRSFNSGSTGGEINSDSGWERVCTTKVDDVSPTKININTAYISNPMCYYEVKNGICYINMISGNYIIPSQLDGVTLASGLPKPSLSQITHTYNLWSNINAQVILFVTAEKQLILHANAAANGGCVFTTFSYPVAES